MDWVRWRILRTPKLQSSISGPGVITAKCLDFFPSREMVMSHLGLFVSQWHKNILKFLTQRKRLACCPKELLQIFTVNLIRFSSFSLIIWFINASYNQTLWYQKCQHLWVKINTKLCTLTSSLQMFVNSQYSSRTAVALFSKTVITAIYCPRNALDVLHQSFCQAHSLLRRLKIRLHVNAC